MGYSHHAQDILRQRIKAVCYSRCHTTMPDIGLSLRSVSEVFLVSSLRSVSEVFLVSQHCVCVCVCVCVHVPISCPWSCSLYTAT